MASSRFLVVLLTALAVFSLVGTAFTANPNDIGYGDWSKYKPKPTLTLPTMNSKSPLMPEPPYNIDENDHGYYEASITLTDTSLPASAPKDVVARRLDYVLQIAKAQGIMDVYDFHTMQMKDDTSVVQRCLAEPVPDTNTVKLTVRGLDANLTEYAARLFALATIAHCKDFDHLATPTLAIQSSQPAHPVGKLTFIRERIIGPMLWMDTIWWVIILSTVAIVFGYLASRPIRRKPTALRLCKYLTIAASLFLIMGTIWIFKPANRFIPFHSNIELICSPTTPPNTPDEILKLAQSSCIFERATSALQSLGVDVTNERIPIIIKIERIKHSDVISITTKSERRLKGASLAVAVANETITEYEKIHRVSPRSFPVQKLTSAKEYQPLRSIRKQNMFLLSLLTVTVFLVSILVACSIHMPERRTHQRTQVA